MNWRDHFLKEMKGLTPDARKEYFRRQAMVHHPDRGGDPEAFAALKWASNQAYSGPCTICEGQGWYREKQGHFTKKVMCPECWKPRI